MAQQYIDFGTFPNDPSADPIRSAFQKINNNFTELYGTFFSSGVTSITAIGGITAYTSTGDVLLEGNFPSITVQTGSNLTVGVGVASNSQIANITSYAQPFYIDLSNSITTGNATFTTNLTTSNLQVGNFVTTSLVPNNTTLQLGTLTNKWGNIFITSNINLGSQNIRSNTSGVIVAGLFVTGNTNAGNANVTNLLTTANANVTGTTTTGNLTVSNYLVGNLIPSTNEVFNLGSPTRRFKDLYLSGNSLSLGEQTMTTDATGFVIPSLTVQSNLSVGTVTATYLDGVITATSQPLITSLGALSNLVVSGGLQTGEMQVQGNLAVASNLAVSGALAVPNLIVQNITYPPNVEVTLTAPGSNTQIMFNDDGNLYAVSGMTFNKTTNLLSVQGNVSGGNLITSGGLDVQGNGTIGGTFAATGNITAGNLVTLGVLNASGGVLANGNISTNGFLQVVGNASVGNITTARIDGTIVSVSGNISGDNLIASGVMQVNGNANVGNLTTNGLVSAATIAAAGNISGGNLAISGSMTVNTLSGNNVSTNGNLSVAGNSSLANASASSLTASGNVAGGNLTTDGVVNATGNVSGGNFTTGGVVNATGNVSGGNLTTGGALSVTGNAAIGNITTTLIGASGTITGGNLSTSGTLAAGNASLGNITSVGLVSASGNVSAGNLATGGALTVSGNANVGNVTTSSIVMNGNLTGAAVMESGLINVTGNMTSGNVITNGFLSVAGTATIGNLVSNNSLTIQNTASIGSQVSVGANLAISSAVRATNTTTVTFTQQSYIPFPVGVTIIISGCTPSSFNGSFAVVTASNSQVTFSNTGTNESASAVGRIVTGGTGLSVTGASTLGGNLAITGALISAASTTATFGPVNSSVLAVTGTANAGNFNTSGNLVVSGAASLSTISANGAISTSSSLTVGAAASIATSLGVGANLSITSISGSGSVVTVTFSAQSIAPFPAGTTVVISGVTPSGYNGSYTVASGNNSQITYSSTTTGTATVLGRIVTGGTALSIKGNANITNLDVQAFTGASAAIAAVTGVTTLSFGSGGSLSLGSGAANIGNITSTSIDASAGNVTANGLTGNGLSITGNASANRITVFTSVATAVTAGGISIGAALNVTNATGTGVTATLTFSNQGAAPFAVGSTITVTNVSPAGYNGTYTVTACTATTVSYSSSVSSAYVSGGLIKSSGTSMTLIGTANVGSLNTDNGTINAGTGNITGGNLSIGNVTTSGSLTTRAISTQGSNITMGAGAISGNLFAANFFSGDGNSITNMNLLNAKNKIVPLNLLIGAGTATITFSAQSFAPFDVGQTVNVANILPSGLNGDQVLTYCNTDTLTFSTALTSNAGFVSGAALVTGGIKAASAATAGTAGTVTASNQPLITSVGTLTNLTLSPTGSISGANTISANFTLGSVSGGVAAAGTIQSTATGLTSQYNVVSSATAGVNDGVRLPTATIGMQLVVINASSANIKVYPATNGKIDALATNASFTLGVNARLFLIATGLTQWYTMVGVYG